MWERVKPMVTFKGSKILHDYLSDFTSWNNITFRGKYCKRQQDVVIATLLFDSSTVIVNKKKSNISHNI